MKPANICVELSRYGKTNQDRIYIGNQIGGDRIKGCKYNDFPSNKSLQVDLTIEEAQLFVDTLQRYIDIERKKEAEEKR
jgi:hypothetical protein